MKDGERGRPIENYGKKEQKEWLDNTLSDPYPCTTGIKDQGGRAHTRSIYINIKRKKENRISKSTFVSFDCN